MGSREFVLSSSSLRHSYFSLKTVHRESCSCLPKCRETANSRQINGRDLRLPSLTAELESRVCIECLSAWRKKKKERSASCFLDLSSAPLRHSLRRLEFPSDESKAAAAGGEAPFKGHYL